MPYGIRNDSDKNEFSFFHTIPKYSIRFSISSNFANEIIAFVEPAFFLFEFIKFYVARFNSATQRVVINSSFPSWRITEHPLNVSEAKQPRL